MARGATAEQFADVVEDFEGKCSGVTVRQAAVSLGTPKSTVGSRLEEAKSRHVYCT